MARHAPAETLLLLNRPRRAICGWLHVRTAFLARTEMATKQEDDDPGASRASNENKSSSHAATPLDEDE